MRFAIATLVVSLATLAHADSPPAPPPSSRPAQAPAASAPTSPAPAPAMPAPKPATNPANKPAAKPDEVADIESREANLESEDPRSGLTFSFAFSPMGVTLGGGVGRGPAVSIRLGHVATRRTVITFEFAGTSALHKAATEAPTLTDNHFGLFAGAQSYRTKYLWVRGAGGFMFLVKDVMSDGTGGSKGPTGLAGLVGAGADVYRHGYFVMALEATGIASLSRDGGLLQIGAMLSFSYY